MDVKEKNVVKDLWKKLDAKRTSALERARSCAEITIPTILPPMNSDGNTEYYTPWQSFGARATRNLASKLFLILLPPQTPFFSFVPDESIIQTLQAKIPTIRTEMELALKTNVTSISNYLSASKARVAIFNALLDLVITGSALIWLNKKSQTFKKFRLDNFVVERDPDGNLLTVITRERISRKMLDEETLAQISSDNILDKKNKKEEMTSVYTYVYLDGEKYKSYQEIDGVAIEKTEGEYKKDALPWVALRWAELENNSYGRGPVEEFIGDLKSLESLSEQLVKGVATGARVVYLVSPSGVTNPKRFAEAETGDAIRGDAKDITTVDNKKYYDFTIAASQVEQITARLSAAFLLNSAVRRNAERVTAEEIRYMAKELEQSLGGVYSQLSVELQLPLVNMIKNELKRQNKLVNLPDDSVEIQIVTGIEGLGRGHDIEKLSLFDQMISQVQGAESYINLGEYVRRVANSIGVEPTGLIKTDQQVQQEQQQAQMAQLAQSLGPKALEMAGKNQGQPPQQ